MSDRTASCMHENEERERRGSRHVLADPWSRCGEANQQKQPCAQACSLHMTRAMPRPTSSLMRLHDITTLINVNGPTGQWEAEQLP